jgi:predicted amidohydrolase YtcJ
MGVKKCFLRMALLAGLALAAGVTAHAQAQANSDPCANSRDLRLTNGKIATMDAKNSMVSEVTIQEGRFAYVGPAGGHKLNPCTKVIDLHGRTVVPGLIDNHNHFVLFGSRPGHEIQLENANTIAQAMDMLKSRAATTPSGAWVTTIGDWATRQFAENRYPTVAELDQAVPNNPVLLMPGGGAPVTNTLGKKYLESKGVTVSDAGIIAAGAQAAKALNELRALWTLKDEMGGYEYAQEFMLSYGLTTSVDQGYFALPSSTDVMDDAISDGIASLDLWHGYDGITAMDRENKLTERVRLFIIEQDKNKDVPILKQRLLNTFPEFGNDMLRISGIGEFASNWFGFNFKAGQHPDNFQDALEMVAKYGWNFQQHAISLEEVKFTAQTFLKVNEVTPIASLHWSIGHVAQIDPETIDEMKGIGAGLALHGYRYLSGAGNSPLPLGPPYRTALKSGIHVGAGSDAGDFFVLDPWPNIYYIVTGKDVTGKLVNDGEQLDREQALRMYSSYNPWFIHEEDKLGSIETGKLGDLAVLSADYFDPKKVSDEDIKSLKSVLTVVGGKVVYNKLQ